MTHIDLAAVLDARKLSDQRLHVLLGGQSVLGAPEQRHAHPDNRELVEGQGGGAVAAEVLIGVIPVIRVETSVSDVLTIVEDYCEE